MRPIHVFHLSAAPMLAELVSAAAPDRDVRCLADRAALRRALADIEVLFAPMPPRTGWADARRLRLVQLAGVGADHFLPSPDLPPAVEVATLRGLYAEEVAEHVTLMALALVRQLRPLLDAARARRFEPRALPRLAGRRVVLLGAGAIGRATAARLNALKVRCWSVSRSGVQHPEFERAFRTGGLLEALEGADGLVVAVPLTDETRGLVDAEALAQLDEGGFVVDVSRGGVVHEAALLDALSTGRLHVARDVFMHEPLPADSPFFDQPNCLVTPHIAGYVEGYLEGAVQVLLDNVRRLERGAPRRRLLDRASNY